MSFLADSLEHLVRAGKSANGGCLTEVFQLARLSGNRLALAVSPSGQAWNPNIRSCRNVVPRYGPNGSFTSVRMNGQ